MKIAGEKHGNVMVFTLDGRIDSETSPAVQGELMAHIQKAEKRLVLDLSATKYVSSAGLRVFMMVAKRIDQEGGKFVLCSLGDAVKEVLEISGFNTVLKICSARDDAIALAAG